MSLEEAECATVFRRWAQHLVDEVGDMEQASLILLSLGDYLDVLLLLMRDDKFERAALFARAASEEGLLSDEMQPGLL